MPILVIGNGESRKHINLKEFSKDYTLVGCNAIHRDMEVEHLVCCDRRMVEEATHSGNTSLTKIYARPDWARHYRKIQKDKRVHQVPDLPYEGELKQDQPIHWGSGPYAVLLASRLDSSDITLIGFDLYPSNEKVNNIYKGTEHYSKKESNPVDYNFWIYQIAKVFKYSPDKKFIIKNKSDWKVPREWKYGNVIFEPLE